MARRQVFDGSQTVAVLRRHNGHTTRRCALHEFGRDGGWLCHKDPRLDEVGGVHLRLVEDDAWVVGSRVVGEDVIAGRTVAVALDVHDLAVCDVFTVAHRDIVFDPVSVSA